MQDEVSQLIGRYNLVQWGIVNPRVPRERRYVDGRQSMEMRLFLAAGGSPGIWRKVYRRAWRKARKEQAKKDLLKLHKTLVPDNA